MISFDPQPERKRLQVFMADLLSVAEVEAFGRDEQDALIACGMLSGDYDMLVVTEGNVVQTPAVNDALAKLMLDSPIKARKIAIIRDTALTRIQTRRVLQVRGNTGMFHTVAEAEEWLAEAD